MTTPVSTLIAWIVIVMALVENVTKGIICRTTHAISACHPIVMIAHLTLLIARIAPQVMGKSARLGYVSNASHHFATLAIPQVLLVNPASKDIL